MRGSYLKSETPPHILSARWGSHIRSGLAGNWGCGNVPGAIWPRIAAIARGRDTTHLLPSWHVRWRNHWLITTVAALLRMRQIVYPMCTWRLTISISKHNDIHISLSHTTGQILHMCSRLGARVHTHTHTHTMWPSQADLRQAKGNTSKPNQLDNPTHYSWTAARRKGLD